MKTDPAAFVVIPVPSRTSAGFDQVRMPRAEFDRIMAAGGQDLLRRYLAECGPEPLQ